MSKKKKLIPYTYEFTDKVESMTNDDAPEPKGKQKHVGIELECIVPHDHNTESIAALLILNDITEGVIVKTDGSIHGNGVEICIINTEKNITKVVNKVCKVIKDIGGVVNNSCGLHVHLDMRHRKQKESFKNLVEELPTLTKMVKTERLRNQYCELNKTKELDVVLNGHYHETEEYPEKRPENFELDRYLAINPWSLQDHNTIEVRLHEGTLDSKKINKWIKKLVTIVDKKAA